MKPSPEPNHYQDYAEAYLERVGKDFVRSRPDGLFEPKTDGPKEQAGIQVSATISDQRTSRVRPKDTLASVLTAVANSLSALISLGTLVGLIFTLGFAQKQWNQMITQSEQAADALAETKRVNAVNSFDSQRNYSLSRHSLEDVQRAFVFPQPVIAPITSANGAIDSFVLGVQWNNSGSTPTKNLTIHTSYQLMKLLPNDFAFPELWESGVAHDNYLTFIAPKGAVGSSPRPTVSSEQLEAMHASGVSYYMWGEAKYRDVFQHTKAHLTQFCFRFYSAREAAGQNSANRIGVAVENCALHNCSDDDCNVK